MSTRSILVQFHEDIALYDVRYVHNDGGDCGPILLEHYTDPEKVKQLFALGELSSLERNIGEKHDFEWFHNMAPAEYLADPRWRMCNVYHRDRGDELQLTTGKDLEKLADQYNAEYVYQWHYGIWVCYEVENGKLVHFDPLTV